RSADWRVAARSVCHRIVEAVRVRSALALLVHRTQERAVSDFERRRVLVIGGFGFIGVNLTERLRGLGARVTVAQRSGARHDAAAADAESRGTCVVEADLRDAMAMKAAVAGQDVVFNLAGQSGGGSHLGDTFTTLG